MKILRTIGLVGAAALAVAFLSNAAPQANKCITNSKRPSAAPNATKKSIPNGGVR